MTTPKNWEISTPPGGRELDARVERYLHWREHLPKELAHLKGMNAIEALGDLKRLGHIGSLTLVNAPPRTVSTIVMKCIGESPSLHMQGFPLIHEVLDDTLPTTAYEGEWDNRTVKPEYKGLTGVDVLVGMLIDEGIERRHKVDLVCKIMAHSFTGKSMQALLPSVDNVVSVVRHPAIHMDCVNSKIIAENPDDYHAERDFIPPMKRYWRGFADNIHLVDKWKASHPDQHLHHVVIDGDTFLAHPQKIIKQVCDNLSEHRVPNERGSVMYDEKMTQEFHRPVFFSQKDGWGHGEIKSTRFNGGKHHHLSDDPTEWEGQVNHNHVPLYRSLMPVYTEIVARHPNLSNGWRVPGLPPGVSEYAAGIDPSPNLAAVNWKMSRAERERANGHKGGVIWMTGLSGSGKTSLAKTLQETLHGMGHKNVYIMDGGEMRKGLCKGLGFSEADRKESLFRISTMASALEDAGFIVIVSTISPDAKEREEARKICPDNFHLVHVNADIKTCEERDPKIYQRARAGEINHFPGVSAPYEEPAHPDLILDTVKNDLWKNNSDLLEYVEERFVKPMRSRGEAKSHPRVPLAPSELRIG